MVDYIIGAEAHLSKTVQARMGATYEQLTATWDDADGAIPTEAQCETAYEALQPTRDWEVAMAETDNDIPRELEDLYDAMSPATQAKVATKTRDKIIAKKELRGTKP